MSLSIAHIVVDNPEVRQPVNPAANNSQPRRRRGLRHNKNRSHRRQEYDDDDDDYQGNVLCLYI